MWRASPHRETMVLQGMHYGNLWAHPSITRLLQSSLSLSAAVNFMRCSEYRLLKAAEGTHSIGEPSWKQSWCAYAHAGGAVLWKSVRAVHMLC